MGESTDYHSPLFELSTPWSTDGTSYWTERLCRVIGGFASIGDALVSIGTLGHVSSTLHLRWTGYWTRKRHAQGPDG